MNDLVLLVSLIIATNLITSMIWIAYHGDRLYDENRRHARQVESIRAEYRTQDQMLRGLTLPQVMGSAGIGEESP